MKKEILHLCERQKKEYIDGKILESIITNKLIEKKILEEADENTKRIEAIIKEVEESGEDDSIDFGKKEVIKE